MNKREKKHKHKRAGGRSRRWINENRNLKKKQGKKRNELIITLLSYKQKTVLDFTDKILEKTKYNIT